MNRLQMASSPYLRQHADNPVDWFEWSDEAFARAREQDVPVFLSVGYSSCHWCHVMAHESFEDAHVAALLNANFVSIKVDREERPDVDAVYMNAVQALTGRGGWPMSVFLTPAAEPFFAGTYWPRDDRGGMPGFVRVLTSITDIWSNQRDQVNDAGGQLRARLREVSANPRTAGSADAEAAAAAAQRVVTQADRNDGGFGDAPKFPQAMTIEFLLAYAQRTGDDDARDAATHALTAMARGGIYDHVGGGFARYATDRRWLIPHFEKMLYDNALLVRAYTHAFQMTGDARYRRVVGETIGWMLSEMAHDTGGLACALDADSEGQEGRYYVWRPDEFAGAVERAGADAELWMRRYGVTIRGNFADPHGHIPAGTSILHEAGAPSDDLETRPTAALSEADQRPTAALSEADQRPTAALSEAETMREREAVRGQLAATRAQRVRPDLDDKVLVSWNGLAISALAEAGAVFGEPAWIAAAGRIAQFIADALVGTDDEGDEVLWHRWTPGHGAGIAAFAEDVSYLAQGLLTLYEADHDPRWLRWAQRLADDADARFRDPADGTYFTTPVDGEQLIARPRELLDNATPATSSVMTDVHLRLAALTGDPDHMRRAEQTLATLAGALHQMPLAFGELLRALERLLGEQTEVAIVGPPGPERDALVAVYRERWRPSAVLAVGQVGDSERAGVSDSAPAEPADAEKVALLADRPLRDGRATAYVCHNLACEQPVTDPDALRAQLDRGPAGGSATSDTRA